MVTVTGKHGFAIEQLDMEIAGKGQADSKSEWQATAYCINDPSNLGVADINYWVVIGSVGASEVFTRNGGASVQARRIGSKQVRQEEDARRRYALDHVKNGRSNHDRRYRDVV
ncbi:MAG: hypothetical protein NTV38_01900, partial [Chloroflexi bacterium]|nr:hypothetical protein [Chloroflexota bacterium]